MKAALAQVGEAVEGCLSAPVFALSSADLLAAVDEAQILTQRLAAVQLRLIREVEARDLAAEDGATSTATWLRMRWRIAPATATRLIRLASDVDSALPIGSAALAEGAVNVEQVQVIAAAVADLPAEHRRAGEAYLVEHAAVFGPRELTRLGERLLEVIAPEVADERAAAELTRAEERGWRERALSVLDVPGSPTVRVSGWLNREGAAVLRAALDPLSAPRPQGDGDRDVRSPGQRRADALVDVCRLALACGELPDNGGDRPQIVVTVPFETLRTQVAAGLLPSIATSATGDRGINGTYGSHDHAAHDRSVKRRATQGHAPRNHAIQNHPVQGHAALGQPEARGSGGVATVDDGARLTAAAARRLACDAAILPAVLDGQGQVLDLGRQRRLFTGAVRRALVLRDRGCAFPSCDRPARWCDGHHIRHWADGGSTALDNAVLLCGYHHRLIHQNTWQVRINPADGRPEFLPPPQLDPAQRPRRNDYHRRQ